MASLSALGYWRCLLWLTLSLSRCLGSTGWPTQSRGRSCRTSPSDCRPTYEDFNINPRTFTQSHTLTVAQGVCVWRGRGGGGGGGFGLDETAPRVFDMLEYSEAILPSVESFWSSLQNEVYFMGGGAAWGLWRYQEWSPSWPPSWILPKIRNHHHHHHYHFHLYTVKTIRLNKERIKRG